MLHLDYYSFLFLSFSDIEYLFQAVAGLAADGRQIVARAKSEATNYERFFPFFLYFQSPKFSFMYIVLCPSTYKFHLLLVV